MIVHTSREPFGRHLGYERALTKLDSIGAALATRNDSRRHPALWNVLTFHLSRRS